MGAVTVQETTNTLPPQRWLQLELKAIDSQVGRWQSRRFEMRRSIPPNLRLPVPCPLPCFAMSGGIIASI